MLFIVECTTIECYAIWKTILRSNNCIRICAEINLEILEIARLNLHITLDLKRCQESILFRSEVVEPKLYVITLYIDFYLFAFFYSKI